MSDHVSFRLPFSVAGRAMMRKEFARKEIREELRRLDHYGSMARELGALPCPVEPPTMAHSFDLRIPFDSLSLYPGTSPGPDGIATVGYTRAGRWWIVGLELDPYYGKETVTLPAGHPLHRVIRDALQLTWADHIQSKVDEDLAERGWVQADPNEQHRLSNRQMGI